MNQQLIKSNSRRQLGGFTIIEVVLVLAIAGLIFLMVFIALPTLQRNQRDTQRRSDVARLKSQIVQFQTNNKGNVPTQATAAGCPTGTGKTIGDFIVKYVDGNNFADPDGTVYTDSSRCLASSTAPTTKGQWRYATGQICDGENITSTGAGTRDYAIQKKLEGSGTHCVDSR